MRKEFILIDGSYIIFYRYYSLIKWWSISKQVPLLENPSKNERFIELFKTIFIKKIKEIPKKLKIKNPVYIVGKDCHREKIWRNEFIDNYKGERKSDNYAGYFFKLTYQAGLFEQAGIKTILSYHGLEADDCLALTAKFIYENYNQHKIHIIANDMDYVQLCNDNIDVYNLKYKKIYDISSTEEAEKFLFCKIIMGDKSDNIPSIFPKCGLKTAVKCYEDNEYFESKLKTTMSSRELYERNKKIIDFNLIPEILVNGFLQNVITHLDI